MCCVRAGHVAAGGALPGTNNKYITKYPEGGNSHVAKMPHVEEEFRIIRLYLNVCSAWMIYKIGIISKRYLINSCNFAVAYSRAFVSLLYFFTSLEK